MEKRQVSNILESLDWITVGLYLLLVLMGWLNVYAAVYNEDYHSIFDISQRYGKQMLWILAAVLLIIIILLIDVKIYVFFSYFIYGFVILLLLLVLTLGVEVNASKSWFEIAGIRIQPAEFSKVATILAIANYLSDPNRRLLQLKTLLTTLIIIAIPMGLILLQNDTGTAIVFVSLIFMLYREGLPGWILFLGFMAIVVSVLALTKPFIVPMAVIVIIALIYAYSISKQKDDVKHFSLGFFTIIGIFVGIKYLFSLSILLEWIVMGVILASLPLLVYYAFLKRGAKMLIIWVISISFILFSYSIDYFYDNFLQPHQKDRIDHVLGINFDPQGAGYNVHQSKIAIGSGGFWGKGFLQGTQTKFDFVPEQSTDFIFCTIGEEWGFVGSTTVIMLFLALLIRIIILAERQRSHFSRIYGYGVFSILFFHVAINIGMTIGITPVIGIPLPFFSYGGSSLWAFTILLFIFLRLDANRRFLVK